MPAMTITVNSAMAASTPRPPSIAQRNRETGTESSISSRPSFSSEAQPPTSVAAAKPARMNPKVTKASWRKAPAPDSRSTLGKTLRKIDSVCGDSFASASVNEIAAAPKMNPITPTPIPHHARGEPLTERALERPAEAEEARGKARPRDAGGAPEVPGREQPRPHGEQHTRDDRARHE